MSRRDKYPAIHSVRPIKAEDACECACCDKPAINFLRIKTDEMRGNDDVFAVCQRHESMCTAGEWRRFYSHERTKANFIALKTMITPMKAGEGDLQ